MIHAQGIGKRYGNAQVLQNLTFNVPKGVAVALWGPNGVGKSTTLKCLLGLIRFQGKATIDSIDVSQHPREIRRRVGYVPQEFAYYDLTVDESLEIFTALKRVPHSRGDEVLSIVGLGEQKSKQVGALSGGMRQRLALALALLGDPAVLFLDEPTASLDATSRRQLLSLLQELRRAGKTILFVSHRPEEVLELADTVLVMDAGRDAVSVAPTELIGRLGLGSWLRLQLEQGQLPAGRQVLEGAGFEVRAEGRDLWVRVRSGQKGHPLGALCRAGLSVVDFELEGETWTSPPSES